MKLGALVVLVRRDLGRTRGALVTCGFGIAAGIAALVFFVALGLGVRGVLLGDVFPIDQIELEPPKAKDPGLLGLVFGGGGEPPGVSAADLEALRATPGVVRVFPKLRFAFPASGRGGKELFGHDVGTSELIGDGIDPALVDGREATGRVVDGREATGRVVDGREATGSVVHGGADHKAPPSFRDPLERPGPACTDDAACGPSQYCERPSGAPRGQCSDPVPALVSRYLVEIFDKSIAPAHNLPPIGETLVARAQAVSFDMRLGESILGKSKRGAPRSVRVRVVGVSRRAIDLGVTLPLSVVQRWNREYAGDAAAERASSAVVEAKDGGATTVVLAKAKELHLEPKDTRARDVAVLVTSVMALLTLVALVILLVSASTIAYTFRALVTERRAEIALYRAVGATAADMRRWMLALAGTVGVTAGVVGVVVARGAALATDLVAAKKLPDFPFKPSTFFAFPGWLLALGVVAGALFAALGAFGAARRAARADPSAALG